jgi:hypothetical protein
LILREASNKANTSKFLPVQFNKVNQSIKFLAFIEMSAGDPTVLNGIFCVISQYLQENSGVIYKILL